MMQEQMVVKKHSSIAKDIYEMVLAGDLVRQIARPGQFIHIKVGSGIDPLLRRPISIAELDRDRCEITILYRAQGKGTKMMAEMNPGEKLDVLGPLGNGFPVDALRHGQKALLVGGGIGVPPLYELSKQLKARGVEVRHVLGFESAAHAFYIDQFSALAPTSVATVDGSRGTKGFVTDALAGDGWNFDCIYACGPAAMLRALETEYPGRRGFFSLEERMACGIGACYGCVCRTKNSPDNATKKVCSDGPVFEMGEVLI
ncbi:dihydroorotate dehydrogenase B (NAD(+)), electron transfer subunit [Weizmannia acidilactici]|uniref:Dihydroorotate dehydrogenase B (NAD(+)), electron transfer subunit n=1 Tax=Weizmannia acidilactici TaxID=2607726 RepID=A0A5J4JG80_9BACI|nr:dihydroorotate dehydrogenase electron transfer subunit [Weizmannia acidilactici]GER65549.1 dihydroorotate dehydrogenase B, electron transfer subunit [Weizmannia acidilactici]GER70439.1 dihydroorotate dehydrogenase B (NAD(+)), electron transfer subunit [Weizmannia acidilactici]GER74089.1 dihydroorotate dehydrogenase B (NAD(+)), electron transfer subunit [Weizmannia acidilactici]